MVLSWWYTFLARVLVHPVHSIHRVVVSRRHSHEMANDHKALVYIVSSLQVLDTAVERLRQTAGQDRTGWRGVVFGLCSTGKRQDTGEVGQVSVFVCVYVEGVGIVWVCIRRWLRVTWIVVSVRHRQVRTSCQVHSVPCMDPGAASGRRGV